MTKPARREASEPAQHPETLLRSQIGAQQKLFSSLLGSDEKAVAKFMSSAWQAVRANPDLLVAHRGSLMMALGEAAALGLDVNPNLGEFWLIPRNGKDENGQKIRMVDGQTGYQGLMKLARRAAHIDFYVNVARRGDLFREIGGTNPSIVHEPCEGSVPEGYYTDDAIVAAYAVAWTTSSSRPQFVVVRRPELLDAASMSGNPYKPDEWSNVWVKHFVAMAKKTALRRLSKLLDRADDLRIAVSREEAREAGKDPGVLVEQLRGLLKTQAPVAPTGGLDGLISLPMPAQPTDPEGSAEQQ